MYNCVSKFGGNLWPFKMQHLRGMSRERGFTGALSFVEAENRVTGLSSP